MSAHVFAAVDLGASGGRVMAGVIDRDQIALRPVHRFPNGAHEADGHLRWDLPALYEEVLAGLGRLVAEYPQVESIGIDTWGVDYGLLDGDGNLLALPIAYRDDRTSKVVDEVHALVPRDDLFAVNGLQVLPFNTIYQLVAERQGPWWDEVAHVVLLPDLLAYWLTGQLRTEVTNSSTTGLLDVHRRTWSTELLGRLDIPVGRLPPIEEPGTIRGSVRPELSTRVGLRPSTVVTTVGSHDTASAVVGVPASTEHFAYVASGTWSLVGLELDGPVLTRDAQRANFTNEAGVDGRIRFLRNTGGLWLLQESMRTWAAADDGLDLDTLLAEAETLAGGGPVVDVDDPAFLPPGAMPDRIAAAAVSRGHAAPSTPAETVRCIIDSLAGSYAATVLEAAALAGVDVDTIHVVGGGSQNALLCQLAADLAEVPVVAGPVEATALGNVLVQARAHGAAPGSLEEIRSRIAAVTELRRFEPRRTAGSA